MNALMILFACIGAITLLLIGIVLVLDLIDRYHNKKQNKERNKNTEIIAQNKEVHKKDLQEMWSLYPFRIVHCTRTDNIWYEVEEHDSYANHWYTINESEDSYKALRLLSESTCKAKIQEILEERKPVNRFPLI